MAHHTTRKDWLLAIGACLQAGDRSGALRVFGQRSKKARSQALDELLEMNKTASHPALLAFLLDGFLHGKKAKDKTGIHVRQTIQRFLNVAMERVQTESVRLLLGHGGHLMPALPPFWPTTSRAGLSLPLLRAIAADRTAVQGWLAPDFLPAEEEKHLFSTVTDHREKAPHPDLDWLQAILERHRLEASLGGINDTPPVSPRRL